MTNAKHATDRGKLFILAAICLSALVLPLSFTGGAVATPAIGRDLGGSPVALTWITNAFMLTFGSLLMAAGALADVYGRKRLFTIGMLMFTLASLAQSFAPSVVWLDVLRGIQGVAGAAALASGSAALFRFPRFVGVQVLPIGTCYCYIVLVVMLPLRFIGVEGLSEIDAGWLLLALSAPMLVVPMLAATLTRWLSAGVLSGIGFLIAAVGLHWLSLYNVGEPKLGLILPMLLIGIGAGLPWGLMDGLSVSVVPKERAGMASGIFSTTRVAGEGIALAIVVAILAWLVQTYLEGALTNVAGSIDPARIAEAVQRITTGDLAQAARLLPEVSPQLLAAGYTGGFQSLLNILTVITVLSAVVVLGLLGRTATEIAEETGLPAISLTRCVRLIGVNSSQASLLPQIGASR